MMRSLSSLFTWSGLSPLKKASTEAAEKTKVELNSAFEQLARSIEHHRARKGFGPEQFENWTRKLAKEYAFIYEHCRIDEENIADVLLDYITARNKSEPVPECMIKLAEINQQTQLEKIRLRQES